MRFLFTELYVVDILPFCLKKVKVRPVTVMKAQKGRRFIALFFIEPRRWMVWVVNAKSRPLSSRE
jgi:hypothetical protein